MALNNVCVRSMHFNDHPQAGPGFKRLNVRNCNYESPLAKKKK